MLEVLSASTNGNLELPPAAEGSGVGEHLSGVSRGSWNMQSREESGGPRDSAIGVGAHGHNADS